MEMQKDKSTTVSETDICYKRSSRHPTLTPGIFTIYCPHAVCYGFEILTECESPRHPFQIFKTRFVTGFVKRGLIHAIINI